MCALDLCYPGYGLSAHKGYPTPNHLEALQRLGPTIIHRRSFAPVRNLLEQRGALGGSVIIETVGAPASLLG